MTFRLRAPGLDFWVDVRLRSFKGRWVAVADIADDLELGLGLTPSEAIAAALSPFGVEARAALLTDPTLALASRDPTSVGNG